MRYQAFPPLVALQGHFDFTVFFLLLVLLSLLTFPSDSDKDDARGERPPGERPFIGESTAFFRSDDSSRLRLDGVFWNVEFTTIRESLSLFDLPLGEGECCVGLASLPPGVLLVPLVPRAPLMAQDLQIR